MLSKNKILSLNDVVKKVYHPRPLALKACHSILTRVSAAKLDCRITHVGHTLAVALITQVHTVCVPVTAPTHGNAQAIHPTLELVYMAAARWTGSLREKRKPKYDSQSPQKDGEHAKMTDGLHD